MDDRNDKQKKWKRTVLAAAGGALVAIFLVYGITHGAGNYGLALFVAAPILQGAVCALLYSPTGPRPRNQVFASLILSGVLSTVGLLVLMLEGFICIAMAAPIWFALMMVGSAATVALARNRSGRRNAMIAILLLAPAVPAVASLENEAVEQFSLMEVTSEVTIAAPPKVVWPFVVEFQRLPEPTDWLFRTGVAYPVEARIDGHGVGAIRYCEFTTGPFVEPITVWDEPGLLQFSVTQCPAPLTEQNPFGEVHPPHLDGYFVSEKGQFELMPVGSDSTLLRGTTWYRHSVSPEWYWRIWSDWIIHRIHMRVLDNIKQRVESGENAVSR